LSVKKVIIIGGGISGLSLATFLSNEGFNVTVIEKRENCVVELTLSKQRVILNLTMDNTFFLTHIPPLYIFLN